MMFLSKFLHIASISMSQVCTYTSPSFGDVDVLSYFNCLVYSNIWESNLIRVHIMDT